MEHLKKAVSQWEKANEQYKKETQQHAQRIGSVLRTFWALDMKKNADNIKESIAIVGELFLSYFLKNQTVIKILFRKIHSKNGAFTSGKSVQA